MSTVTFCFECKSMRVEERPPQTEYKCVAPNAVTGEPENTNCHIKNDGCCVQFEPKEGDS